MVESIGLNKKYELIAFARAKYGSLLPHLEGEIDHHSYMTLVQAQADFHDLFRMMSGLIKKDLISFGIDQEEYEDLCKLYAEVKDGQTAATLVSRYISNRLESEEGETKATNVMMKIVDKIHEIERT